MGNNNEKEKVNLLKQDLDLKALMSMFSRKPKNEEAVILDNSNREFIAPMPEVNILPETVKESYAAQDLMKKFIMGAIAAIGIFALLWGVSIVLQGVNDKKINTVMETTSQHNQEASSLKPYSGYRGEVEQKRSELASKMSTDINVGKINQDFTNAATASGYTVSSITLSLNGDGGGSCVNPDPFNPAQGIGCINFSLTGNGSMGAFLNSLSKPKSGFVNAYIPNALSSSAEGATVDGSVGVTQDFYTKKYETLNQPLDSILNPVAPEVKENK